MQWKIELNNNDDDNGNDIDNDDDDGDFLIVWMTWWIKRIRNEFLHLWKGLIGDKNLERWATSLESVSFPVLYKARSFFSSKHFFSFSIAIKFEN